MVNEIRSKLSQIEKEYNVIILYACESGSRAWGFESADSDYDIRFIFIRPTEDYLKLNPEKDIIEIPIRGDLDINGWDIKKSLELFYKSNPPLIEWLQSPIIYIDKYNFRKYLLEITKKYFNSKNLMYHYLNMSKRNYKDYFQEEKAKLKKYFYVIRPILCCMWLESEGTLPPTVFQKMLYLIDDAEVRKEIDKLLVLKSNSSELDMAKRISVLDNYIETNLFKYEDFAKTFESKNSKLNYEILNKIFLKFIHTVNLNAL